MSLIFEQEIYRKLTLFDISARKIHLCVLHAFLPITDTIYWSILLFTPLSTNLLEARMAAYHSHLMWSSLFRLIRVDQGMPTIHSQLKHLSSINKFPLASSLPIAAFGYSLSKQTQKIDKTNPKKLKKFKKTNPIPPIKGDKRRKKTPIQPHFLSDTGLLISIYICI